MTTAFAPLPLTIDLDNLSSAYAGSIVYPPGGRYGPRVQQDLQLVMLYTGEMTVTIDGRILSVAPGHVVLLKPGHEESFTFSKTEDTWHRWIAIRVDMLSLEAKEALYALPEVLPLTEEMNHLTGLMVNLIRQFTSEDDIVIRSLAHAALHLYPNESLRLSLQQEKHPAVYSAIEWIRSHYAEALTLSNIASQAGVSPEHLLRLFKKHEGTTPIEYVWKYRIDRSIELLTHTGLNVTEIAERCGFKTSHHFARMIKQVTRRTATDIRRQSWSSI